MINKITFKNYKLFKEKQTLEIKPITILIGKNNTGKSAILKLMTIIEGGLGAKQSIPIKLENDGVKSGNEYKDLIYGKFGRGLEIELFEKNKNSEIPDKLTFRITVDINKNIPVLDLWKLNDYIELKNIDGSIYENEVDERQYSCEFFGFYLASYFNNEGNNESGTINEQPHKLDTDFIGSIRDKTRLDYRLNPVNTKSFPDGKYLYDFLIRDYLTTDKKYFTQISKWVKDKFEGWELYIDADGGEPYHIQLRKGKLEIDITETGMGIGQSLPLIIRANKPCEKETLIIVEEPEAHLHPYAHAQLAELFADSLKIDTNKKYLFETHSQNFILRLRRLVAEGKLSTDSLGIYYVDFDEDKNESNLKEISVDSGGGVEWWPDGIFGETSLETRAIYNAQLNDLRNVD